MRTKNENDGGVVRPTARRCLAGLGLLGLMLPCTAGGCATTAERAEPVLTPEQRELNLASYDQVWTTIRDRHWDPELGGLDWEAVRDKHRPQVESATRMSQARTAMNATIQELNQSHFAIIPAAAYDDLNEEASNDPADQTSNDGDLGIDLRVIDDQALVTEVRPGPAADAGVRPGWEIVRIGETDVAEVIERVREAVEDQQRLALVLHETLIQRLEGQVGDEVALDFETGTEEKIELMATLATPTGNRARMGHLPAEWVRFEAHRIDDDLGYVRFNIFLDPARLMPAVGEAVQSFEDARGIIIDLRGNPGGLGAMAMGMAGWFVNERDLYLGRMCMRDMELKFVVNPRPWVFEGPVAILVDSLTGSTSEIFTGGLQDLGRVRVFGTRTPGAALPAHIERLPNGDGFMYAVANYISAGGQALEGRGVIPDQEIQLTRTALLAGEDPVLDAAATWIRSRR